MITLEDHELPDLCSEAKELVRLGVYSLYTLENQEGYLLVTPREGMCCSNGSRKWLLDPHGKVAELGNPDAVKIQDAIMFKCLLKVERADDCR